MRKETSLKYFLVQSFGSILFLIGVFNLNFSVFSYIGLLLKAGVAPLHFWVLSVTKNMSWSILILLLTVQKLGPLLGLALREFSRALVIILSALLGRFGGFIQSNLRLILSFSRIAHLSWLLINLNRIILFFSYYLIYSFISILLGISFNKAKIFRISQINFPQSLLSKLSMSMRLLSLGGLPPLLGFFIKWITIEINFLPVSIYVVLVLSTCISLFFYLKIVIVPLLRPFNYLLKWDWVILLSFSINCLLPLLII